MIRISFQLKMFMFSTFLVLTTVAVIAYDYLVDINEMLVREYQSQALDKAEKHGLRLEDLIRDIETSFINMAQATIVNNKRQISDGLKDLTDRHPSFSGMWSVMQNQKRWTKEKAYASPKVKFEYVKKILSAMEKSQDVNVQLTSVNKKFLILVRRFQVLDSDETLWVVGVFENKLVEKLVKVEKGLRAFVLDYKGEDLYTSIPFHKFFQNKADGARILRQIKSEVGASFVRNLKDFNRRDINVSFYRIPLYNISLVFHIRSQNLIESIEGILHKVGQKVALIVLFSVLFAYLLSKSFTKNLAEVFRGTVRIANGEFDEEVVVKSRDEIGILAESVNHMSNTIRELLESVKSKVRLEQELETAQTVQNTFFKENHIENYPFRIASYYTPASECGGDWWGHFDLAPGIELIVIGDATGHGVPAALITAMAYATCNTFVKDMLENNKIRPPSELLSQLNFVLYNSLEGKMCMTFVAMIFDSKSGKITYSNGGHVFPYLIPKSNEDPRIKSARARKMRIPISSVSGDKSTSILGIDSQTVFKDNQIALAPGDKFILYTDGITESVNEEGKMMGSRGFIKLMQKVQSQDCLSIRDHIVSSTIDYNVNDSVFEDDVTLVVVEYEEFSLEGVG